MEFNKQEVATILAALRAWQIDPLVAEQRYESFFEDCEGSLNRSQIDILCERINLGPHDPSSAEIKSVIALIESVREEDLHEEILYCATSAGANICNSSSDEQAKYLIEQVGLKKIIKKLNIFAHYP